MSWRRRRLKRKRKTVEDLLHDAVRHGYFDVSKSLVQNGAHVNELGDDGRSALHLAVDGNHLSIARCLLEDGHANVNLKDLSEETPLHWAVANNFVPMVSLLLNFKADISLKNQDGGVSEGWFKGIKKNLNDAKKGRQAEIKRHTQAMQDFDKRIDESKTIISEFQSIIESGDLKTFTPRHVHALLEEIDMAKLYSFFLETKIVDGEKAYLESVNEKLFEDNEDKRKFPLGWRKRIIFHLKHIEMEKKVFRPSNCDNFMGWDCERVCQWLGDVSCSTFVDHFSELEVCGITLACVSKAELVKGIRKEDVMLIESSCSERDILETNIDDFLWVEIEKLRKVLEANDEKKADRKVPQMFLCQITQEIMIDPVITPAGINYERANITKWVNEKGTCPFTRQSLELKQLYPNRALKEMIEKFKRENA